MKPKQYIYLLLLLFSVAACTERAPEETETVTEAPTATDGRQYYQLKAYTFGSEDQSSRTDAYLRDAYLPALKKLGIEPVGVFKNRPDEKDPTLKTYVLLPLENLDQLLPIEEQLNQDEAYAAAGKAYLEASYDQAPYQRIESTIMRAFSDFPEMAASPLTGPRSERVYELRSYESPTEKYYWNKVDMFNAGGEIKLFDRLGFNAVFYAEVVSGSKMPNLMYMTTFPDMPTRDTLWKQFFASPEWEGLKAMEKYQHNVSHADILLLYPTEYSDY